MRRTTRDHNQGPGILNKSMNLGAGKGPDGAALARTAARGLKGKGQGESIVFGRSEWICGSMLDRGHT